MYKLEIENNVNERLQLTQNESKYQIVNISGLNPANSEIFLNSFANRDGEFFKNVKVASRNIAIQIRLNGNVEENRINLYNFFKSKELCKIYYSNGSRNVSISGYVEACEVDFFTISEIMQISIICYEPFFKDLEEIIVDLSSNFGGFEFPFFTNVNEPIEFGYFEINRNVRVLNSGDIENGFVVSIKNLGTEPIYAIKIYNSNTNEFIGVTEKTSISENEKIIFDTRTGKRSVKKIKADGIEENLINNLDLSSVWLQLQTGINYFNVRTSNGFSDNQNLRIFVEYSNIYNGV